MIRTFLKSKIHRASVDEDEIDFFMPKVVLVDDRNRIKEIK